MFAQAARTLAGLVSERDLASGLLFPPLTSIRDVSLKIAVAVAGTAVASGFAGTTAPRDLEAFIREQVFEPEYREYV
jgi:malate dehydrogenase (oxaloacetate-decarboxylating)(NADP+)